MFEITQLHNFVYSWYLNYLSFYIIVSLLQNLINGHGFLEIQLSE